TFCLLRYDSSVQRRANKETAAVMTTTRIISCFVAAALLLIGCAGSPSRSSATPASGKGRRVVYRISAAFGYAQRSDVFIGDRKVARSSPGKKYFVDVASGTHVLRVPSIGDHGDRTLSIAVKEGEIVYVKTWLGGSAWGGYTNLVQVDAATG